MLDNLEFGKSTITNKILNKKVRKEGEVSKKSGVGKQTTTDATLYEIDEKTYLLDTPGFQTLDISDILSRDLGRYFREIKTYVRFCKYPGCSHIKEENCGVRKALKNGKISEQRYYNYIRLYSELKDGEKNRW